MNLGEEVQKAGKGCLASDDNIFSEKNLKVLG